jgi:ketosteroid isomerase-like protein
MARSRAARLLATALSAASLVSSVWADDVSDEAQIRAATRDFVEAFNSRDVERLLLFYAEDYVDMNLPQPRQSRAQRRLYLSGILGRADTTVAVDPEQIIVAGDYAFVRGTILLRRALAGGPQASTELRYLELLRRFPQGWKAIWGIDAEIYPSSRD